MRLLHTTELRFEEFFDSDIPNYAILSHRWGPDEISYQAFMAIRNSHWRPALELLERYLPGWFNVVERLAGFVPSWAYHILLAMILSSGLIAYGIDRPLWLFLLNFLLAQAWNRAGTRVVRPGQYTAGYMKILACCKCAVRDWTNWVWIDTCCIDKSSSVELSEAINSMYHWYQQAHMCYAYLSDVSGNADGNMWSRSPRVLTSEQAIEFAASAWFTRGWTLQELLAPRHMSFLAADWTVLGSREDLAPEITTITGISAKHLLDEVRSVDVNIATKLSWTVKRQTSRLEDTAYCLLGLFGVKMPLLYGEGQSAFRRLQMELISSTNDESLFAWHIPGHDGELEITTGLLAPREWSWGSSLQPNRDEFSPIEEISRPRYSVTNQGLELIVPEDLARKSTFLLPLNYRHYEGATLKGVYAIHLQNHGSTWVRVLSGSHAKDFSTSSDDVYCFHKSGLYIVPIAWVWSREDLARRGSLVIYASIEDTESNWAEWIVMNNIAVRSDSSATPELNGSVESIL